MTKTASFKRPPRPQTSTYRGEAETKDLTAAATSRLLTDLPTSDDIAALRDTNEAKLNELAHLAQGDSNESYVNQIHQDLATAAASQFNQMAQMQERIKTLERMLQFKTQEAQSHANFHLRGSHLEVNHTEIGKQSVQRFYRATDSGLNKTAPLGKLYRPSQLMSDQNLSSNLVSNPNRTSDHTSTLASPKAANSQDRKSESNVLPPTLV